LFHSKGRLDFNNSIVHLKHFKNSSKLNRKMSDDVIAEANAKNPRFTHWAANLVFSIITMWSAIVVVSVYLHLNVNQSANSPLLIEGPRCNFHNVMIHLGSLSYVLCDSRSNFKILSTNFMTSFHREITTVPIREQEISLPYMRNGL
jgi:hypothetical protein